MGLSGSALSKRRARDSIFAPSCMRRLCVVRFPASARGAGAANALPKRRLPASGFGTRSAGEMRDGTCMSVPYPPYSPSAIRYMSGMCRPCLCAIFTFYIYLPPAARTVPLPQGKLRVVIDDTATFVGVRMH